MGKGSEEKARPSKEGACIAWNVSQEAAGTKCVAILNILTIKLTCIKNKSKMSNLKNISAVDAEQGNSIFGMGKIDYHT